MRSRWYIKTECCIMGAISSLRDSCEMRVLILSAIFACAAGAPSGALFGTLTPIVVPYISNIPTIPAGDIQAAVIDAKVQAEDLIRAASDRSRELTEQAIEDQNEKVIEVNDLIKEKSQEAFWSTEDSKWQALTALQTAEAKIDGAVASNADLLGKAVLNGVVVSPVVSRIYSGVIPAAADCETPVLKAAENPEGEKIEGDKDSVQIESATSDSESDKAAANFVRNLEASRDSTQSEYISGNSAAAVPSLEATAPALNLEKSAAPQPDAPAPSAPLPEAPAPLSQVPAFPLSAAPASPLPSSPIAIAPLPAAPIAAASLAATSLIGSPLTIPTLKFGEQWMTGPVFVQPNLKAIAPFQLQSPFVSTLIKTPC
ncbi:LOW QUALITY PROTEIN: cuticular protein hypothetical 3 [Aphomia sociella]